MYEQNWALAKTQAESAGLRIVEHGWEQHVIIDEAHGIVYRYPRHAAAAAKLEDEVQVLHEINHHTWMIAIPVMREHTHAYTSYNYIPGEVLDEELLASLDEKDFEHIGFTLGEFLAQLHALDHKVIEKKKTKQTMTLLEYYSHRIGSSHESGEHTAAARAALEQLQARHPHTDDVVVHGDLHGYNVVIEPATRLLKGVIDLSEMEIGGRHQDFRKIFMTDARLLEPAIAGYKQASGIGLNPDTAKLWAYVNEWANLCHFADDTENPTYKRALAHLEKWGQV